MKVEVFESKREAGEAAAREAAGIIRGAVAARGEARVVAATGASQFEFLDARAREEGIDWGRVTFFHLDEYVGLPESHPASFRKYLRERLAERVRPGAFHFIDGEAADPRAECRRLGGLISQDEIDVAFVGIGENGHLAFNDPPADFETGEPYIVVDLDDACRRQQVGEGWFGGLEEVPRQAISMSVKQILRARRVVCVAPDRRKAEAVRDCLELEVSPLRPASALQRHDGASLYLDRESASLLRDAGARAT
ncbi:MAG TPA: glucosamine-6-phosphate deaminase [Pyrinomonadaceae bacterium]|jgi:glucosamine-6-phosphate deaminase|nr:glucosamine-6-phosphate deaminase [Pyrinomonadaceae bacterium]